MEKTLEQINAELFATNEQILDLKTEIICLEIERERLIAEHNKMVKQEAAAND